MISGGNSQRRANTANMAALIAAAVHDYVLPAVRAKASGEI
jgi:hypothetical protein